MTADSFTPDDDVAAIVGMFGAKLADPEAPFTLIVRMTMRPGTAAAVDAAFAQARPPTLAEPGAICFDLNRDSEDPDKVVVYERWRSLRDIERHLRQPYVTALRNAFNQTIDGLPEFTILTPAGERRRDEVAYG
jgi:quinol monooxygenase YgiN